MALTTAQVALLNNFYKTQPALNEPGVPSAIAGILLGDVIKALETAMASNPPEVSDVAYGAGWNGDVLHAPSKNAIYDKLETVIASIPTLPTMGTGTTNGSGEIVIAGMTATGKIVVTPTADLGNDLVFSHVTCGVGKITISVKDASAVSPIAASAAGAGFAFSYVIIALS
jgi:hypothetical protein